MTYIYLVRHCEALGNQQQIFQGSHDEPITETGARQLECLSRRFADVALDAVYSGPLLRARKTADAILGSRAIPLSIEPRVTEICGGDWEHRSWAELPQLSPEQCYNWVNAPWRFEAPQGEKMTEVYARMAAALCDLAAAHDGQTIAIASHGCAIRNALCFAHGKPIECLQEIGWSDHTAVSLLLWEAGEWHVLSESDSSHLPNGSSKAEKTSWWRAGAAQKGKQE